MAAEDRQTAGFKDVTRLPAARERLLEDLEPHGRSEEVPLLAADRRAIAAPVMADRPVPHYDRAAMDGYAVRAADTFGATARSPVALQEADAAGPDRAVRVHTGSELPDGADAVVKIEQVEAVGDELEVFDAVAEGENVGSAGEDVEAGRTLYKPPHQLRPSDLGLLKSVGCETVTVHERPSIAVLPTGEELIQSDPAPGEIIETNGQTVAQLVERWGGAPSYRDVVTDDPAALADAIEQDLDHDAVVTTGGSSVGSRDLVPEVVEELGEVLVHGVALKPGHPVALGGVESTPVLMLPGYPVACIVNAVQFLRPAVKRLGGLPAPDPPTRRAQLERKIASEPGTRTFARVRLDALNGGEEPPFLATPTRASGAGVLSSVALADGWVVIPEAMDGFGAGRTVDVELWEWSG
jgi:molybdopterin molybdotransferase